MGWVVSITPRPLFGSGERTPGTHCTGGWVGSRAGLDAGARRKIICFCRGSNPGRPVRSQTLYWLSYPGSCVTNLLRILLYTHARMLGFSMGIWGQKLEIHHYCFLQSSFHLLAPHPTLYSSYSWFRMDKWPTNQLASHDYCAGDITRR
jgi:hypothetical protein